MSSTSPSSHNTWHPKLNALLDKLTLLVTQARDFDLSLPTHESIGRAAVLTLREIAQEALDEAQHLAVLVEQLGLHPNDRTTMSGCFSKAV